MNAIDRTEVWEIDPSILRCVVDEDGRLIYAGTSFCLAIGADLSELVGKKIGDVLSLTNIKKNSRRKNPLLAAECRDQEIALHRLNRDPLLLQAHIDRMTVPSGRSYIIVTATDAADRIKLADKGIHRSAEKLAETLDIQYQKKARFKKKSRLPSPDDLFVTQMAMQSLSNRANNTSGASADGELRHFLNMSNDLLAITTASGNFLRLNPSFKRILGFTDFELVNQQFLSLIHPEDTPRIEKRVSALIANTRDDEPRIDFEARTRTRNSAYRWVEWSLKKTENYLYAVGRDVTDIKLHEEALNRREQQLSEAQKIARMGHWRWIVGDDEIDWSEQIYRIFGVTRDEFIPSIENVNGMLHKRDLGRMMQAFQRAIVEKNDYTLDFRIIRPDGAVRNVHCEGRCDLDEHGGVQALFGIMQDVTERYEHERALRESKEAAEQAYASKSRFLANMSHELRTPLNAIIGFSEMMQRQLLGPIGSERYLDYIKGIRESGEHLLDLISDILDMSKIEAGKYELETEPLRLPKLARLTTHMMEGRAHEGGITVHVDCEDDAVPPIKADRRAIMQILLNLLSNAIKFTESGGKVEISCRANSAGVMIVVSDSGVGIPAMKLKRITRPFEQAASEYTRKHEGSGLGLAITKSLAELHNGHLHIQSKVGVGTTVTVTLPPDVILSEEALAAELEAEREHAESAVPSGFQAMYTTH